MRLTTTSTFYEDGSSFSPNGKLLAFRRSSAAGADVYLVNANGGDPRPLVATGSSEGNPAFVGRKRVVFERSVGDLELFIVKLDGTGELPLTDNAVQDHSPASSPDGRRIFFYRFDGHDDEIFSIRPNGTGEAQVTDNEVQDRAPNVSPDGRRLVVSRTAGSEVELVTMNIDGSGERPLTDNLKIEEDTPAFSPTGKQIAFSRYNADTGDQDISLVNVDGSGFHTLTPTDGYSPDWQPIPVRCGGKTATQVGTKKRDVLVGTPGRDVLAGLGGGDVLKGKGGRDILCGAGGRDRLLGGRGRDRLLGGKGRDRLRGGPGADLQRQ